MRSCQLCTRWIPFLREVRLCTKCHEQVLIELEGFKLLGKRDRMLKECIDKKYTSVLEC